ncbi:hypothetical protein [Bifidobacterium angulatum]|uniref:hypothetical protein n=1 Tax=Bifidobacterium angulatum TaxID=1683 RepID=UPI000699CF54|nr:hypothetical protein [Bifidobacterium angulatum]AMK57845.1 hypothetical protein Bang102_004805 [Bifidobacterium angulatum]
MARKNGGYSDFAPIPVTSATLASQLLAEDVTIVENYDEATKTRSPKTRDGLTQYEIQTLFIPFEGDERHTVAIVPVKIWAKTKPVVKVNAPVAFVNMRVTPWSMNGRTGLSYSADGIKQAD